MNSESEGRSYTQVSKPPEITAQQVHTLQLLMAQSFAHLEPEPLQPKRTWTPGGAPLNRRRR